MRFQVPQFIEVEDKIIGPLTIRQFIYLAGGVGWFVAMWIVLPLWAAILLGAPVTLFGLALAFYKVNDRPFIDVLQSAFEYSLNHKLYVWEKRAPKVTPDVSVAEAKKSEDPAKYVPAATSSKLKDLAWSLDIHESAYSNKNQR